jgi:hypothetical protein
MTFDADPAIRTSVGGVDVLLGNQVTFRCTSVKPISQ